VPDRSGGGDPGGEILQFLEHGSILRVLLPPQKWRR
jgi:hypothetical protein